MTEAHAMFQASTVPAAPLPRSRLPLGQFGWLYRNLPPCPALDDQTLQAISRSMMATKPAEHPRLPAGYTYFGQFIAHDLSFSPASMRQRQDDPEALHNFRSPALDLDSIYGQGPQLQPFLYQKNKPFELLLGCGIDDWTDDLPRNLQGLAVVADPRNDENILQSQLCVVFLLLHNRLLRRVERDEGLTGHQAFARARRLLQWHYQWVVLNDYLPRILHPSVLARLGPEDGAGVRCWTTACPRHFSPTTGAYIPVEFAAAAFRFGHSLVREGYHLNPVLCQHRNGQEVPLFHPDGEDLRGGAKLRAGWQVKWEDFLDGMHAQRSGLFDTHLARPLGNVPVSAGKTLDLAKVDLALGQRMKLPCGQALARAMCIDRILTPEEVGLAGSAAKATPLWYYILKESEVLEKGLTLGRLGSEIVGEVLLGLVRLDRFSYLSLDPAWRPPASTRGAFGLLELIRMASQYSKT